MTRSSNRPSTLGGHVTDYGLLWWLMPLDGTSPAGGRDEATWMASGNFHNWLLIVPKHDLVVVVTGGDNGSFGAPVDFMHREILPAVKRPEGALRSRKRPVLNRIAGTTRQNCCEVNSCREQLKAGMTFGAPG
jgi:hypothetical protein